MNIDLDKLTINVNLHAIEPTFLNLELHYVIAENENAFRFADWREAPNLNEEKFYCFLQEKELLIPAGNIILKESYVITRDPAYPSIKNCKELIAFIETVKNNKTAKAIRQFSNEDLAVMQKDLQKEFATVEKHVVTSPSLQHHIFVVSDVEISVAPTMIYFRLKTPFAESHYYDAAHEQ
jgi:hypothetical protein